MATDNKDILSKIGMIGFLLFIVFFVGVSSFVYFNNSSNVAIQIRTDNEVNREKTAVNEALTRTLVMKNDTLTLIKVETKKKDSVLYKQIDNMAKDLKKVQHEKDSLTDILRHFKQSDIQPINRNPN